MFVKGDFVVERAGWRAPASFGVVTEVDEGDVLTVRYPEGTFYSFASHCQHYKDWLREQGF